MDRKEFKEFFRKRSTIWTLSLCMTGIIVLGGISAVNKSRTSNEVQQTESELGESAFLDENAREVNDTLNEPLKEEQAESDGAAEVSGNEVVDEAADAQVKLEEGTAGVQEDGIDAAENGDGAWEDQPSDSANTADDAESAAAASTGVISEQSLLMEGIDFAADSDLLMWPAAGTILIDYSMDGSVYFPTLNQYKYNPALVIGSDVGNQVLAATKGVVESIYVDEETGTTLVMNIGNGYKLTYGQLKELAVEEGDIVEEGAVIGYVSEPTKYYTQEGSNLYFAMTEQDVPVDPVQYLG